MRDRLDALLSEQLRQRRVLKRLAGNGRKDQPLTVRESSRLVQHGESSRWQRDLVLAPCLGSIRRDRPDTVPQLFEASETAQLAAAGSAPQENAEYLSWIRCPKGRRGGPPGRAGWPCGRPWERGAARQGALTAIDTARRRPRALPISHRSVQPTHHSAGRCYATGPNLSLGTLASELESILPSEDMRHPSKRAMTPPRAIFCSWLRRRTAVGEGLSGPVR